MSSSTDPFQHQQIEKRFIDHVERLLTDDRLRIDTIRGRRPVSSFQSTVRHSDDSVELKRLMSRMGRPDRDLQKSLPQGRAIEVDLWQKKWWILSKTVARLRIACMSPVEGLIGSEPTLAPMGRGEVERLITE